VIALSMALSFGAAILAPTHEAVASSVCEVKINGECPNKTYNGANFCCEGSPNNCLDHSSGC